MSEAACRNPVARIEVRIVVGDDRMAATDDPIFLGLRGAAGREFRLQPAKGTAFRRNAESHFVLGPPSLDATNVAHPELNDPTQPALSADGVEACYVRKDSEPIPNVRGLGEMDDRVLLVRVEVTLHGAGGEPRRFLREGPIWLGLVCGNVLEVPGVAAGA